MGTRVFLGRLSNRARERDIEDFFRGYGKITDVVIKANFAFIEFDDYRDADDAIHDLNGKDLCGERVSLEFAKRPPKGRDAFRGGRDRGRSPVRGRSPAARRDTPPHNTKWRIRIEELSSHYDWNDLKEMFREGGFKVAFCDAHRPKRNEGVACFNSEDEMKDAIKKFDGKSVNGRAMKLFEDVRDGHSRSRSPVRESKKSKSRSKSGSKSRSSSSASSKKSGDGDKNGKERSASPSDDEPKQNGKEEKSKD